MDGEEASPREIIADTVVRMEITGEELLTGINRIRNKIVNAPPNYPAWPRDSSRELQTSTTDSISLSTTIPKSRALSSTKSISPHSTFKQSSIKHFRIHITSLHLIMQSPNHTRQHHNLTPLVSLIILHPFQVIHLQSLQSRLKNYTQCTGKRHLTSYRIHHFQPRSFSPQFNSTPAAALHRGPTPASLTLSTPLVPPQESITVNPAQRDGR